MDDVTRCLFWSLRPYFYTRDVTSVPLFMCEDDHTDRALRPTQQNSALRTRKLNPAVNGFLFVSK